ncbi:MAG: hypothetical protein V7731_09770, partial [Amphritea sp.]
VKVLNPAVAPSHLHITKFVYVQLENTDCVKVLNPAVMLSPHYITPSNPTVKTSHFPYLILPSKLYLYP